MVQRGLDISLTFLPNLVDKVNVEQSACSAMRLRKADERAWSERCPTGRAHGNMIEVTSSHGDVHLKYVSCSITVVSIVSVVVSHRKRISDTEARRFWRRSCAPAEACRSLPKTHILGGRPCIVTWRWDTLSWMLQHPQLGVSSPKGAAGLALQVVISCHVVHGV